METKVKKKGEFKSSVDFDIPLGEARKEGNADGAPNKHWAHSIKPSFQAAFLLLEMLIFVPSLF